MKSYLTEILTMKKMTISELSRKSGVGRNTIYLLNDSENLQSMKLGTIQKICDALDCHLGELIVYAPQIKNNEKP